MLRFSSEHDASLVQVARLEGQRARLEAELRDIGDSAARADALHDELQVRRLSAVAPLLNRLPLCAMSQPHDGRAAHARAVGSYELATVLPHSCVPYALIALRKLDLQQICWLNSPRHGISASRDLWQHSMLQFAYHVHQVGGVVMLVH